uniref:Uncharacterized protein n=1 Tax=Noctiluca scintillans TaxID=2966 RepID=A0A7S0ZRQ6_NOCSC|mmetsp:Transcript_1513/g.4150  ORF Transcript_1513/g.4150 Transcript_1513/m.4150 type:complete len:374 (+) Transcript_1513:181-1302(+)|eukprot:CAMPEP_0194519234 /NCGR_PEP_ID=MMETSP0253-20130528/52849_1 /TAXON_ID=2966 /ORGANISM="Noctiluca scintillans" /LENGTH=373 /DNA_ID=CAMNT_0039363345 /DNA_START=160 /DNA_END=1281 /DNA_ORIENTATION=+
MAALTSKATAKKKGTAQKKAASSVKCEVKPQKRVTVKSEPQDVFVKEKNKTNGIIQSGEIKPNRRITVKREPVEQTSPPVSKRARLDDSDTTGAGPDTTVKVFIKPEPKVIVTDSNVDIPATDDELLEMVQSRTCPFMGVSFRRGSKWVASWYEKGIGQRMVYFIPGRYRTSEMTQQEAGVEALRCAIRCRLANAGSLQKAFTNPEKHARQAASMTGVSWKKSHKCWVTQRRFGDKWLWVKYFKPDNTSLEAVEAARRKAISYLREQESLFWASQGASVDPHKVAKEAAGVSIVTQAGPGPSAQQGFVSVSLEAYSRLPLAGARVVCSHGDSGRVVGAELVNANLQYRVLFSDGDTCAMAPSEVQQFRVKDMD